MEADGVGSGSHGTGYTGGLYFDECIFDSPTTQTCFTIPHFTPVAVKNGGGAADPVGLGMGEDGGAADGPAGD